MKTVRHAESECHAWFEANFKHEEPEVTQNPQHVANSEICMTNGSWTHDALFNSYGWTWTKSRGVIQLLGERNQRRRISPLH